MTLKTTDFSDISDVWFSPAFRPNSVGKVFLKKSLDFPVNIVYTMCIQCRHESQKYG